MMNRPAGEARIVIGVPGKDLVEEAVRPINIVTVGPRRDELQTYAEAGNPTSIAAKLRRIRLRREVATATPALVANAPKLHVEWFGKSRFGAHLRKSRGSRGRVAIFHPVVERQRRKTS